MQRHTQVPSISLSFHRRTFHDEPFFYCFGTHSLQTSASPVGPGRSAQQFDDPAADPFVGAALDHSAEPRRRRVPGGRQGDVQGPGDGRDGGLRQPRDGGVAVETSHRRHSGTDASPLLDESGTNVFWLDEGGHVLQTEDVHVQPGTFLGAAGVQPQLFRSLLLAQPTPLYRKVRSESFRTCGAIPRSHRPDPRPPSRWWSPRRPSASWTRKRRRRPLRR